MRFRLNSRFFKPSGIAILLKRFPELLRIKTFSLGQFEDHVKAPDIRAICEIGSKDPFMEGVEPSCIPSVFSSRQCKMRVRRHRNVSEDNAKRCAHSPEVLVNLLQLLRRKPSSQGNALRWHFRPKLITIPPDIYSELSLQCIDKPLADVAIGSSEIGKNLYIHSFNLTGIMFIVSPSNARPGWTVVLRYGETTLNCALPIIGRYAHVRHRPSIRVPIFFVIRHAWDQEGTIRPPLVPRIRARLLGSTAISARSCMHRGPACHTPRSEYRCRQ